jgi:hypothetical protein
MQRFQKTIAALALTSFSFIALFGLELSMVSETTGAAMSSCVLMQHNDMPGLCPMTWQDHVLKWQQTFVSVPWTMEVILSLAVISLLTVLVAYAGKIQEYILRLLERYRTWQNEHPDPSLNYHLVLALARGKLQPKLYA